MTTTTARQFKDEIFEQTARIGKAVSSAKRIELLDLLAQGTRQVEAVADESGLAVANTSRHLQILRAARLVGTERSGGGCPLSTMRDIYDIVRESDKVLTF